eukprot:2639420-Pleurochrysis_carterae.AAC.4
MENCACGPKGAARCVGFEQSTSDEGNKVNDRARGQKEPIALGVLTPNEGRKMITLIPHQVGHRQAITAIDATGGTCSRIPPAAQSNASAWQLCFTWCRLPRMTTTNSYMGLRAIL